MSSFARLLRSLLGISSQDKSDHDSIGDPLPPGPASSVAAAATEPQPVAPGPKALSDLSCQEFELLIGEFYRRQGYAVAMCSGDGADGGVDLRLRGDEGELTIVQCKHWKVFKVSAPAVRELFGVMVAEGAARAILVTTGKFTRDARDFAAGKALELVDGQELGRRLEEAKWNGSGGTDLLDVASWAGQFARSATITTPACPFCHAGMVLRQARATGARFWGCSTYPRCRGKRNVRPELLARG